MANKNQVTLTFSGDEKKLTTSTEKVGDATEKMANRVKKSSDELERATGKAAEDSGRSFGGFIGKVGEVGLALNGLSAVTDVISNAIGGADIGSKLQAQLGATPEAAGKVGEIAGKVYADNFGTGMDDVGEAVSNVVRHIGDVGALGEEGMKKVSESALTLRDVFDIDVTESTNAVGRLLKTGLVKDAQSGMDLVAVAFQKIPGAADDAIDTMKEYSIQFQKLGLDGPKSLGLISQGMKAGARDTDTIADALKEFSIRAIDGSAASVDGFKSLGLNAKQTAADIAKGGDSASKGPATQHERPGRAQPGRRRTGRHQGRGPRIGAVRARSDQRRGRSR
jgi:phage-related minor tail protein